jgi:hypothetical protein
MYWNDCSLVALAPLQKARGVGSRQQTFTNLSTGPTTYSTHKRWTIFSRVDHRGWLNETGPCRIVDVKSSYSAENMCATGMQLWRL